MKFYIFYTNLLFVLYFFLLVFHVFQVLFHRLRDCQDVNYVHQVGDRKVLKVLFVKNAVLENVPTMDPMYVNYVVRVNSALFAINAVSDNTDLEMMTMLRCVMIVQEVFRNKLKDRLLVFHVFQDDTNHLKVNQPVLNAI